MQEKFGRKTCPFLYNCDVPVTRDFFTRICKTPGYVNCHHYAKRVGELKKPMDWLQKTAVDQAKMLETGVELS